MAQLVEHIVHIDGVTGSSPVSTTKKPRQSVEVFFIGSEEVGEGAAFASMEVFARPPPVAEAGRGKTVRARDRRMACIFGERRIWLF